MKKIFVLTIMLFIIVSQSFSQEIPIIDLRINTTQSAKDDYANFTDYIPCTISLLNGSQINQDIPVLLRNIPFGVGGQVLFSSSGGTSPGNANLSIIVPKNNSSVTFFIKGNSAKPSIIDKDAIIEVCNSSVSTNLTVLARKALMVTSTNVIPNSLPIVDVEINSVSTLDDYLTWSPTVVKIRLSNHSEFSSPLNVVLRNMNNSTGKINFMNSNMPNNSTATDSTLSLSLPNSGTWVNFYIAGKFNNASLRDKDAVMEIISGNAGVTTTIKDTVVSHRDSTISIADSTIITRDSLVNRKDTTITPRQTTVSVRDTMISIKDTLITAGISRDTIASGNDIFISIKGTVIAVRDTLVSIRGTVVTVLDTIVTNKDTLIAFQDTVRSYRDSLIAINDTTIINRDTIIAGSKLLAREGLMVRVRKNANNITAEEQQRLLNAFVTFNNTFNGYSNFIDIHSKAGNPEEHNGPGFLAWHRAYILDLEREFQGIDPSVTLPYWDLGNAAPNIFSKAFMGSKPIVSGDAFADFNIDNPFNQWNVSGGPGIRRTTAFADNAPPSTQQSSLRNEFVTLSLGTNYEAFRVLEINPHGNTHNLTGSISGDWMRGIATAVKDPIFFLLHSNVDRLWAKWQWINNRFDENNTQTYSAQGAFPNSGSIHIGHYLNDTMWPWNGITGTYNGSGTILTGNRPTTAPGGIFPYSLSFTQAPVPTPKPFDMINYRKVTSISSINAGLGFCYDDVPFQ